MNISSQVYETEDYGIFVEHDRNRPVRSPKKLRELEESMKKNGFLDGFPINVINNENGKMKILFGHNRFWAAQRTKTPVKYVVLEKEIDLDSVEKPTMPWRLWDYIIYYVRENKEDYVKAKKFVERTGISPSDTLTMLEGYAAGQKERTVVERAKSGKFTVKDMSHAVSIGNAVKYLKENLGIKWASDYGFVRALSKAGKLSKFDFEKFKSQAAKHKKKFAKQRTWEDYLKLIEEVYNKGNKGKKLPIVFLVTEQSSY
jgi:hypothetical protein